jgi:diamine N-acetyltransferase
MEHAVTLQEVTRENWADCAAITLPPDQASQVASNLATIAESKFQTHYRLRAICVDSGVVGMLAYCQEIDEPTPEVYWLFRIIIDPAHQMKGIGRQAITLACEEMTLAGARMIRTMHRPDNVAAHALYARLGFTEIGRLDDGDVLLEIRI